MWDINTTDSFTVWLNEQEDAVQEKILGSLFMLSNKGPNLGRPYVDALQGSKFNNMKELRIQCKGSPFRLFFAFDPKRNVIVLCAGNKKGKNKLFYTQMLLIADTEYQKHLDEIGE
ncbi:toxin RelE [Gammaproteobacteria bacterium]|nr:toxin RelE [Gammaproteobacteria bacterium]